MDGPLLSAGELAARCGFGGDTPSPGQQPVLLVDLASGVEIEANALAELSRQALGWPWVLVGIGPTAVHDHPLGRLVDVVVEPGDARLDAVLHTVTERPIASTALVLLLRSTHGTEPLAALIGESATYSTLQAGPEFAAWRAGRPAPTTDPTTADPVRVEAIDGVTHVVLARPHRHNPIDRRLRLALHDALRTAAAGEAPIVLRGDGPSFSSGGDLAEFGSFDDPATAHLVRMANHPAAAMIALGPTRTTAHVHGACVGGGLELAAFAGHVVARPDTFFHLPEVGLGLVPGAGGTVSLPRRIGRQRTNLLALTGERLDPTTALAWGLIDTLNERLSDVPSSDVEKGALMQTRVAAMLGVEFPIVAFSHCRDVVAAVTNAGGFGVLGAVAHTPAALEVDLSWIDERGLRPAVRRRSAAARPARRSPTTGGLDREAVRQLLPPEQQAFVDDILARYGVPALRRRR